MSLGDIPENHALLARYPAAFCVPGVIFGHRDGMGTVPMAENDPHSDSNGRMSRGDPLRHLLALAEPRQRPVPACTTASPSPSSSNAECTAIAAACTLSARVTTEMRISLVEIISMLMPAS